MKIPLIVLATCFVLALTGCGFAIQSVPGGSVSTPSASLPDGASRAGQAAVHTETATPFEVPTTLPATPSETPAATPTAVLTPTARTAAAAGAGQPQGILPAGPTQTALPASGCQFQWFASVNTAACPREPAVETPALFQFFERGFMIALKDPGLYLVGEDYNWNLEQVFEPLTVFRDTSGSYKAPPGLLLPADQFGQIWRGDVSEPAIGYMDRLGYAVSPEVAYQALYQCVQGTVLFLTCYVSAPKNGLIGFDNNHVTLYLPGPEPPHPSAMPSPSPEVSPTGCADSWFAPVPTSSCPDGPAQKTPAAAEPFERGWMIWIKNGGLYLVLIDGGDSHRVFDIVYDPLTIAGDTSASFAPPQGLFAPVSGFGLVWRGDAAQTAGRDYPARLGWATAPEFGFETTWQCGHGMVPHWSCYLTGPQGGLIGYGHEGIWFYSKD